MTVTGELQLDLSLHRSMEPSPAFIGPILPTHLNKCRSRDDVTKETRDVTMEPPGDVTKTPRDVTKTRRYQGSLSCLLDSLVGESSSSGQKKKQKRELQQSQHVTSLPGHVASLPGHVTSQPPHVASLPGHVTSQPQYVTSQPESPESRPETDERIPRTLQFPNLPDKILLTGNTTSPTPSPTQTTTNPTSRKRPRMFSSPTLKKTTSRLFTGAPNNYLKGCVWSRDGLALATCSRDKTLRIFNIPDITDTTAEQSPVVSLKTTNIPYDYCWNPAINHITNSCCNLLISSKDSPVLLIDGFTGATLGSYTAFNGVEMLISAFSVAYHSTNSILAGFCKHVRVFDVNRQGKESQKIVVGDKAHQNNNSIVSTIASHPTMNCVFGAGCYNSTVALYSTQMDGVLMPFYGPTRGITQILFSKDGNKLYCGSRMSNEIFCFDTRYNGEILRTFPRDVQTNQRIQFDLDPSEELLATGNDSGHVTLYEVSRGQTRELSFEAHGDTVNGVSFHPQWNLLATVSGRRHCGGTGEGEDNSLKIWEFESHEQ